jgi:hypothetical protein
MSPISGRPLIAAKALFATVRQAFTPPPERQTASARLNDIPKYSRIAPRRSQSARRAEAKPMTVTAVNVRVLFPCSIRLSCLILPFPYIRARSLPDAPGVAVNDPYLTAPPSHAP